MKRTNLFRSGFVALALSVAGLTGCSGGTSLEGTVTYDGQPVDGGTVSLYAEGGGGRNVSGEVTGGKYALDADKHNLTPGTYKVEITWHKSTGKKVQLKNDPGNMVDETKQVIPARYNKASELKVEVGSGSNTKDFDLKP